MENRTCKNCTKEFVIEPVDFDFYEKIQVPPPTFCPDCRQERRYAWRNERVLYRRNCDLCKKSTVTIYHPESPYTVYCSACWWGDNWDPKSFAQEVDFSRPFFDQFNELQLKVPRIALLSKNSVNSEFTNHAEHNKNVYLSFDVFSSENVLYSSNIWNELKDSCDVNMMVDKGTFLYECVSCDRSYNCQFCLQTEDSINCMYCYDCRNCSDCFMSSNLRNKKYCINNIQYSKEDYQKKMQEYDLTSASSRARLYDEWIAFMRDQTIHKFAEIEQSVNVSGDTIHNSKNIHKCFDVFSSENIRYSVIAGAKDCMDMYSAGFGVSELIYESHAILASSKALFSHLCYDDTFIDYCDSCHNSQNLFGSVGLKKAKYCILNKEYTPEEYGEIKKKLIEHMKTTGEYGEFFPGALSPFGYNETLGQIYMPLTKDQALQKGYKWVEDMGGTFGKETVSPDKLWDTIATTPDSITSEVLACVSCKRNYNIVPQEVL